MTMEYVRKTYGVPVYRGAKVRVRAFDGWCGGTIISATHYVYVRPDPWPLARIRCHPTDDNTIRYLHQDKPAAGFLEPHQGRGGGDA